MALLFIHAVLRPFKGGYQTTVDGHQARAWATDTATALFLAPYNCSCYISKYARAKSAIGPAPQAVTKNSEVEQIRLVFGMHDNICLDMRSSS